MSHFEGRAELGNAIHRAVERERADIRAVCREIFEHPEPPFEERHASSLLADYLSGLGYSVERNLADIPTAFRAHIANHDTEAMRKGLRHGHVALLAEFDTSDGAHLHGRQLVAGAALAGAAGLADALTKMYGEVTIIGCPAASSAAGKRLLAGAGVFEPFDVALGSAPASTGLGFQPTINNTGGTLAAAKVSVRFAGSAGESDARQRLATAVDTLDHPDTATGTVQTSLTDDGITFDVTAESNADLDATISRIEELTGSAASETGSSVRFEVLSRTPASNVSRILARRVKTFADTLGLKQDRIAKSPPGPPSDWGHVSLITSTTLARFPISEVEMPDGTEAFAEASNSSFAADQMIACAKAVAMTALDVLGDMEFRGFAEGELIRGLNAQGIQRTPRRWLGVHPVLPRETANGNPAQLPPLSQSRRRRP